MTRSGRCVYTTHAVASQGDIDWYASAGSGEIPAATAGRCAAERRRLAKIKTSKPNRVQCEVPEEKIWEFISNNNLYNLLYYNSCHCIYIIIDIIVQLCSLLRRQFTSVAGIQFSGASVSTLLVKTASTPAYRIFPEIRRTFFYGFVVNFIFMLSEIVRHSSSLCCSAGYSAFFTCSTKHQSCLMIFLQRSFNIVFQFYS